MKLLNQIIYEYVEQYYLTYSLEKPKYVIEKIIYSYPIYTNFPLIEAPINDYEFKAQISQGKTGKVIHIQSIQVLKVYPPECFLWLQLFFRTCDCGNKVYI